MDWFGTHSSNIDFSIPATHRVRWTHDVLDADQETLLELLEPTDAHGRSRVQFWLDHQLAHTSRSRGTSIEAQLRRFAQRHADRVEMVGKVQLVPGGEPVKNDIHILERMLRVFEAGGLDRRSYVVVLGGGAVLDAVGFAASIAHRGLRLVRLPSTTLAQADSAVGVKSAVNLFGKKNWVGAFAVPWGVIHDARLLETLSDRDYRCGFAEAVKVALLKCPPLLDRLELETREIHQRNAKVATGILAASARLHLDHIVRGGDPFEVLEARPLDFGHWSAHRLETLSQYRLRHGEAVAIGVALDVLYSSTMLGLSPDDADRVLDLLAGLGFTLWANELADIPALLAGLEEFRQHLGGRLTLTMLQGIGQPIEVHEVDRAALESAVHRLRERTAASTQPRAIPRKLPT